MAENKRWHETLHDQFGQYFAVDNVLYHEKTDHQDLIIFENASSKAELSTRQPSVHTCSLALAGLTASSNF